MPWPGLERPADRYLHLDDVSGFIAGAVGLRFGGNLAGGAGGHPFEAHLALGGRLEHDRLFLRRHAGQQPRKKLDQGRPAALADRRRHIAHRVGGRRRGIGSRERADVHIHGRAAGEGLVHCRPALPRPVGGDVEACVQALGIPAEIQPGQFRVAHADQQGFRLLPLVEICIHLRAVDPPDAGHVGPPGLPVQPLAGGRRKPRRNLDGAALTSDRVPPGDAVDPRVILARAEEDYVTGVQPRHLHVRGDLDQRAAEILRAERVGGGRRDLRVRVLQQPAHPEPVAVPDVGQVLDVVVALDIGHHDAAMGHAGGPEETPRLAGPHPQVGRMPPDVPEKFPGGIPTDHAVGAHLRAHEAHAEAVVAVVERAEPAAVAIWPDAHAADAAAGAIVPLRRPQPVGHGRRNLRDATPPGVHRRTGRCPFRHGHRLEHVALVQAGFITVIVELVIDIPPAQEPAGKSAEPDLGGLRPGIPVEIGP